ncbi:photosystem reaction center subunit H [Deinococcus sp. KSM4-11]|uniref:PRC-barrel domain-containing protein n=1 Tax=Deinococcus sp. KSM4-11 TaxID=2568654 RepID=UPI0010A371C4|nr:PRC-barrel domain-containing protein [Deinococcus sp. KSM4-11]THF85865.1 photosystem reaction center subunit H [Deinococcus sp. KSM4-11]
MIKGKDILGRPIVAVNNGEKVDTVHDVVFDHNANQVLALLVDEGGWFSAAKAVPFASIRSFGEDAIMIGSADDVTTSREDGQLKDALAAKHSLIGMKLLTSDGQDLGRIADVYFDEETGHVQGYEATGGLFSDMSSGRTFVPAPEQVQIGEDAAIVPVTVAAAMQEQEPGGIKGALQSASASVKDAYGNVAEGVQGAYVSAAGSVKETYSNIADATRERQKEYVVGRTAGSDLLLDDGSVLVHKGDTITALQAERADTAGKLTALATSATGGTLADAYGTAVQGVQERYEDVRDATAERQKAYVVGKTASRDITTEAGEVIVPQGAVITTFQADRAEATGKLAALTAAATAGALSTSAQALTARADLDPNDPQAAVGRRLQADVRAPGGSLVGAQGQIVTPAILERARHLGVEQQLLAATRSGGTAVGSSVAGAGAAVAGGLATVSEGASGLLDRAKSWLGDKREQAESALDERQQEAQEQKVRDALGRPVNRVILAPDDSIILNVGEIITHKAVQAARTGDVLDILLDSVSKEVPDIDPLASRPHETGTAALDGQPDPTAPQRS